MINEHLVPEVEEGRVAMDLMSLAGQLIGRAVQLWDLNAAHTRALGQLHRHVDDYAHMKWALKCNVTCNVKDIFANKTTKQFDGPSHCTCTLFQTSSDKKQYPSSQFHIVFRVCMELEKTQGRGDSVNLIYKRPAFNIPSPMLVSWLGSDHTRVRTSWQNGHRDSRDRGMTCRSKRTAFLPKKDLHQRLQTLSLYLPSISVRLSPRQATAIYKRFPRNIM